MCLASAFLTGAVRTQVSPSSVQPTVEALRSHDFAQALKLSEILINENPRDPRARTLKGMALASLGQTGEALKAFHQALALDPNYVAALEAAAQIEYDAGRPEASGLLEKLVSLDPHDQTAHAMLGALAFKRKDCGTAIAHFDKSPEAISNNHLALMEFGGCLVRAERPGDAIPVFWRLQQMLPDDWRPRLNLGLVQFLDHHYTEAIQTLQPLTDGASPNARALNLLAAVYEANRQTPQAVAALQKATQLAPHEVNNYLDLAALSLDHGAFQVGVDVLTAALKIVPVSPTLYIERGVLYVQLGQFNEADADFQKANTLEPAQNIGTVARGISLVQENELGRSLETVRERLKKAPTDPMLNYLLAEVLIRKGIRPGTPEFREAKDAAQLAVRSKPDFALAYDVLSVLCLRAGQTSQAIDASRQALKADPEDSAAVYHLIVCLRKEGDTREIPQLVKKMADMSAAARERTAALNRYKLVEDATDSASSTHSH
jgi:tetratricopeptide (TPR) repeat protein